jgi:hypothetical protein
LFFQPVLKEDDILCGMDSRYFATKPRKDIPSTPWDPVFRQNEATRMMYLDNTLLDGSFYMECAWFWPGDWPKGKNWKEDAVKAHTHDYGEIIAFYGSNPDDPEDLCGKIELWIAGEKNIADRSFAAFMPAGVEHCPLKILRVDRPIFHFSTGPGKSYF